MKIFAVGLGLFALVGVTAQDRSVFVDGHTGLESLIVAALTQQHITVSTNRARADYVLRTQYSLHRDGTAESGGGVLYYKLTGSECLPKPTLCVPLPSGQKVAWVGKILGNGRRHQVLADDLAKRLKDAMQPR